MRLENYIDSLLDYEFLCKFKFLWKQLKWLNLSRYLFWQLNIIVIIIYYYILLVTHPVSSNYKWDVALKKWRTVAISKVKEKHDTQWIIIFISLVLFICLY